MQFLYASINFLMLVGLIVLFGRKTIVKIFKSRRERINQALSEAESIEKTEYTPPVVPSVADFCVEIVGDKEIAAVEQHAALEAEEMHRQTVSALANIERESVDNAKTDLIATLSARVSELLSAEPYLSTLRSLEPTFARRILEKIEITPGDMAYLKTHDVLYVTLTSAFPLDQALVDEIGAATEKLVTSVGGKQSLWVRVDPSLQGGLRLRIGDTVYDCTVSDLIYHLNNKLERFMVSGKEDADTLTTELLSAISALEVKVQEYQLGRVMSVSDGICWLDGLADIMYGEVIEFECGERGMVLDIEPDRIGCIVYGRYEHIESGSRVRRVGRIASTTVGEELLGRVVDPLGNPIDGGGRIWSDKRRPIEFPAPGIPDRGAVNRPLHTGIKAVDALVPIGKGQRELIIGDRQTGKTSLVVDAILNQKGKNVACIYVAIGQKDTTVADIREKLTKYGAMPYTTIVCAPASASASLQYIAPFAGAAMGEYFMYSGRDVLIIYDDLSKHAVAYREISLLLHRPSGREAYPGDVFYLHSRLLERAAQLSAEKGGGSMTALPIIETQAGDISAYIPTNVISITDGQIFLESDLFNDGQRPAVNVGLSVSRVGSAAQTKLMKQVSSSLRIRLAQYRELAGFAQFGSDVDAATKKVLDDGARMMGALRQKRYAPMADWKQVVTIFAVSNGFADKIEPDAIESYTESVCDYLESVHPDLVETLASGAKMTSETIESLKNAIAEVEVQTQTA